MLAQKPNRIRDIERALQVNDLLGFEMFSWHIANQHRLRTYCLDGQSMKAFQIAQEVLAREPPESVHARAFVPDFGQVAREVGKEAEALRELDRRLFEKPNVQRPQMKMLLIERARLLAAMGNKAQAEQCLKDYLATSSAKENFRQFSDATLILGFLREDAGDLEGAKAAWREVLLRAKSGEYLKGVSSGVSTVNASIAGSLNGDLTEQEMLDIRDSLLRIYFNEATLNMIRNNIPLPPAMFIDCWKTPRGKQAARQFVFQQVSYRDYLRLLPALCGIDLVRREAFGGTLEGDQETVVRDLAYRLLDAFADGTIKEAQVLLLGTTWKGITNVFGWGGVRTALKPDLRGPCAYVLGHRFLTRKNPVEAKKFFEQARDDAPAVSDLRRLAEAELNRLVKP